MAADVVTRVLALLAAWAALLLDPPRFDLGHAGKARPLPTIPLLA